MRRFRTARRRLSRRKRRFPSRSRTLLKKLSRRRRYGVGRGSFGRRRRSRFGRRRFGRRGRRFGSRNRRYRRSSRKNGRKARHSRALPFGVRYVSSEEFTSVIGLQSWWDEHSVESQNAILVALNDGLVKYHRKLAAGPRGQVSSTVAVHDNENKTGYTRAMIPSTATNPANLRFTIQESITYSMYNTANVNAYLTVCLSTPRRCYYSNQGTQLESFPAGYTVTPLPSNATNLEYTCSTAFWSAPWRASYVTTAPVVSPTNTPNHSQIHPYRQYGAAQLFVPFNVKFTTFIPTIENLYLAGASYQDYKAGDPATGANVLITDNASKVDVVTPFNRDVGGGGTPINDTGYIWQTLLKNTRVETTGLSKQAWDTMDWGPNDLSALTDLSQAQTLRQTPSMFNATDNNSTGVSARQKMFGNANECNMDDPTTQTGAAHDWATHPQYKDSQNPILKMLFSRKYRRITIKPGQVFRFTVKSKRYTINPMRDGFMDQTGGGVGGGGTEWPSPFLGANDYTLETWSAGSTSTAPAMGGPGYPFRTKILSVSLRGQTAAETAANGHQMQILPAQINMKKDHRIRYNVKYLMPRTAKRATTVRNLLADDTNMSHYAVQYPTYPAAAATPTLIG